MVAGGGLALGAGQRVFLTRLRVEEYREVLADRPVAEGLEFGGRRPDDAPVTLGGREPQELVPDGAANEVHLHAGILAKGLLRH